MIKKKKLKIIYEDKYLLLVNKPAGLLTVSTDKEKYNTVFHQVYDYLHKKNQKAFIVHRLDKDTSGLVLFAKSVSVKNNLQNNWNKVIRKYYAVVEGSIKTSGEIRSYLKETKTNLTYISDNKGKLAITKYSPIKTGSKSSLLDVEILTGRKNQIRVQLSSINHSIIGDKKYGKVKYKRMLLEAYYLEFIHPISGEKLKFCLELDKDFNLQNTKK